MMPRTRGDCVDGTRPCVHRTCRYHLDKERSASGSRWQTEETVPAVGTRHGRRSSEMVVLQSCTLDLADREGMTRDEVGKQLGITRERVRQIEFLALRKIAARSLNPQHHKAHVAAAAELREASEP